MLINNIFYLIEQSIRKHFIVTLKHIIYTNSFTIKYQSKETKNFLVILGKGDDLLLSELVFK